jgi:hypothetical protein
MGQVPWDGSGKWPGGLLRHRVEGLRQGPPAPALLLARSALAGTRFRRVLLQGPQHPAVRQAHLPGGSTLARHAPARGRSWFRLSAALPQLHPGLLDLGASAPQPSRGPDEQRAQRLHRSLGASVAEPQCQLTIPPRSLGRRARPRRYGAGCCGGSASTSTRSRPKTVTSSYTI